MVGRFFLLSQKELLCVRCCCNSKRFSLHRNSSSLIPCVRSTSLYTAGRFLRTQVDRTTFCALSAHQSTTKSHDGRRDYPTKRMLRTPARRCSSCWVGSSNTILISTSLTRPVDWLSESVLKEKNYGRLPQVCNSLLCVMLHCSGSSEFNPSGVFIPKGRRLIPACVMLLPITLSTFFLSCDRASIHPLVGSTLGILQRHM